ncbi:MAG: exodeoxyribonuclease V subunit alpha [Sporichthyaceae bacterium]
MTAGALDPYSPRLARRADGLLAAFNVAGILSAADVHVATTLGRLGGESDERVLLAIALTVRSTRAGSVVLDLASAADTIAPEMTEGLTGGSTEHGLAEAPPWPEPIAWLAACNQSGLIATVEGQAGRPVRLVGSSLWLARYYAQEGQVAMDLLTRAVAGGPELDEVRLETALVRLFPAPDDHDQRAAAELAARSRLTVICGGPGTGKTTTVARILALLTDQGGPPPRVALAAPTGKAAARLTEAVARALAELGEGDRSRVHAPPATTIHRLLGARVGSTRFRHHRANPLPHDVVLVDEASMVSLTVMARLLEAVRPGARLILVGDPDQLASVEAGAVLGDVVAATAPPPDAASDQASMRPTLEGRVVTLSRIRRYCGVGTIASLATAIRIGDSDAVLALLRSGSEAVEFVEVPDDSPVSEAAAAAVRAPVVAAALEMIAAAEAGDAPAALLALERHRVLCAHRTGPRGVQSWTDRTMRWIAGARPGAPAPRGDGHYVGAPILVNVNDADLQVFNGDTGVVLPAADGALIAAFRRGENVHLVPVNRLPLLRSAHAMTVHRSQGSEFTTVTVVLPPAASPLATRQTLYTAVTRATGGVRLLGSAEAVARAVGNPAARATGLTARLQGT